MHLLQHPRRRCNPSAHADSLTPQRGPPQASLPSAAAPRLKVLGVSVPCPCWATRAAPAEPPVPKTWRCCGWSRGDATAACALALIETLAPASSRNVRSMREQVRESSLRNRTVVLLLMAASLLYYSCKPRSLLPEAAAGVAERSFLRNIPDMFLAGGFPAGG